LPNVIYARTFPYRQGQSSFPGLLVRISNPLYASRALDIDGHLDTGAQRSVFDGWIASEIGLDLASGARFGLTTTTGESIEARVHDVIVSHEALGDFRLGIAFTLGPIRRNLLGRDFLNLIQIGFREHHEEFYVTPSP